MPIHPATSIRKPSPYRAFANHDRCVKTGTKRHSTSGRQRDWQLIQKEVWTPAFIVDSNEALNECNLGGPNGPAEQGHPGLCRGSVGLLIIASLAGAYQVFPRLRTAPDPWQNMVNGHLTLGLSAIHALISVSQEYILARQQNTPMRDPYIGPEPYHRWQWIRPADGPNFHALATLYDFGFSQKHQHERASRRANTERLIILIEQ
jgi:hypothetical protein